MGLYVERYTNKVEEQKAFQESEWLRFRISWADYRNSNRGKNGRIVSGQDLIRLSFDDRVPEYHEIDIEAIKRRFGSKIKKKNG